MDPSYIESFRRGQPAGEYEVELVTLGPGLGRGWQSDENLESMREEIEPREELRLLHDGPQVFYPQPNWKPISMRWLYLSPLIIIYLSLAILQEYLYRYSTKHDGLLAFTSANELSTGHYFLWLYTPTLGLVIFGIMAQATDFEMKKLQPYYLMARLEGVSAEESVLIEPLSLWTYFTNPRLIGLRLFASESMNLLATIIIPSLQNASLGITQDDQLKQHIVINNVWSRLLTSTLCLLAAFIVIVLICNSRDRSGLDASPRGIVGTAKMANRSHVMMLGKNLDVAPSSIVHEVFAKERYFIKQHSITPYPIPPSPSTKQRNRQKVKHPHPSMLRITSLLGVAGCLILAIVLFTIIIFTKANRVLQDVPILTALAVGIKLAWGMVDDAVRLMEPFHTLSCRHASHRILSLDYTGTSILVVPFKALKNNHILLFFVSLNSILIEVLITPEWRDITFSEGNRETFTSFWVSFFLSMFILLSLIITTAVLCHKRRKPIMALMPGTIAASLVMIHQSKFMYDMVNTEFMDIEGIEAKLAITGKKYGYGWFVGRDGEIHLGVEEEELLSSYRSGVGFKGDYKPSPIDWTQY